MDWMILSSPSVWVARIGRILPSAPGIAYQGQFVYQ
jgi:hypothetical protein